jgi:hypothetical protein
MATLTLFVYISTVQDFQINVHMAISKTRSTEHGAHGARSSRKTKILYNKIHCLLLQIFVIINKVFSRFTRWGK